MIRFASAQAAADLPPLPHGDTFTYPLDGEPGRVVSLRSDGAGGFVPIARVTVTFKASLADADADALAQRHATVANGYLTDTGAASGVAEFSPIIVPASVMADFPATAGVPDTVWFDVQAEDADGVVRTVAHGQFAPSGQVTQGQLYGIPADFEFSPDTLSLAAVSDSATVTVTVVDALGNPVGAGHVVTAESSNVLIATVDAASYLTDADGQVTVIVTRTGSGIVAIVFGCEAASGELGGATITATLTASVAAPTLTAEASVYSGIVATLSASVAAPTLAAEATVSAASEPELNDLAGFSAAITAYYSPRVAGGYTGAATDVTTIPDVKGAGAAFARAAGTKAMTYSAGTGEVTIDEDPANNGGVNPEVLFQTALSAALANGGDFFLFGTVRAPSLNDSFLRLRDDAANVMANLRNDGTGKFRGTVAGSGTMTSTINTDAGPHFFALWRDKGTEVYFQMDGEAPIAGLGDGFMAGTATGELLFGETNNLLTTVSLGNVGFMPALPTAGDLTLARTISQTYHGAP